MVITPCSSLGLAILSNKATSSSHEHLARGTHENPPKTHKIPQRNAAPHGNPPQTPWIPGRSSGTRLQLQPPKLQTWAFVFQLVGIPGILSFERHHVFESWKFLEYGVLRDSMSPGRSDFYFWDLTYLQEILTKLMSLGKGVQLKGFAPKAPIDSRTRHFPETNRLDSKDLKQEKKGPSRRSEG